MKGAWDIVYNAQGEALAATSVLIPKVAGEEQTQRDIRLESNAQVSRTRWPS